jgi:hypothetical protein
MSIRSRRQFLQGLALAAGAVPILRIVDVRAATASPHLSPDDPTAKSLAYTEDASTVKDPAFKPGSKCKVCQQYQAAQESGGYAPCTIFSGKSVNANGWCKAFVAKT